MATPTIRFSRGYWDPEMYAYPYLIEFLESDWKKTIALDPVPGPDVTTAEIQVLLGLAADPAERKQYLDDIRDQAAAFSQVFARRLMYTAASHPRTFEVVKVCILIGRALVMHYKIGFNRPRPSQLSPDIVPVFEVPGHPSYPSGHSTQAHLLAHALCDLHPSGQDPAWRDSLFALAGDVARNRERAGVHYPSDSAAGRNLAAQLFAILQKYCPQYVALVAEARKEWI
jgi:acid phosphatase (class A)